MSGLVYLSGIGFVGFIQLLSIVQRHIVEDLAVACGQRYTLRALYAQGLWNANGPGFPLMLAIFARLKYIFYKKLTNFSLVRRAMSVISRLNEFPLDIVGVIGLHLSARGFASLLQVSSTFYKLLNQVHEHIARAEQGRMGIEFQVIPLNAWQTAAQWGQLTSQEARALRIDLRGRRLIFYAGIIDPAMLVLQDKFLTVRNDQTALSNLALGHLDLKQAAILARQISDKELRAAAIQAIVGRAIDENLPESTILEFVSNLVSAEMPMDKIRKTLKKIPGSRSKKRDEALGALALKNGIKIGKAVAIALLIQKPGKRVDALYDIARKDEIELEDIAYIINFIEDRSDAIPLITKIEKMGYFLNDVGNLTKNPKMGS